MLNLIDDVIWVRKLVKFVNIDLGLLIMRKIIKRIKRIIRDTFCKLISISTFWIYFALLKWITSLVGVSLSLKLLLKRNYANWYIFLTLH